MGGTEHRRDDGIRYRGGCQLRESVLIPGRWIRQIPVDDDDEDRMRAETCMLIKS
jgi:hypothetical protein